MPDVTVSLPTLHAGQVKAYRTPGRFKAVRAGRRWGKSAFGQVIACNGGIKRRSIGWFAPEYKFLAEPYSEIRDTLQPVLASSSKVDGLIRTTTGGHIDFWSLDNPIAGRGRKYHDVIIDEAAFTKPGMLGVWEKNIKPTLLDYTGRAWVLSNCNGISDENFFYVICKDAADSAAAGKPEGEQYGFVEYWGPSEENPRVPVRSPGESEDAYQARRTAIYDELRAREHPLVWQQEYRAEFIDWSGVAFFERDKFLDNGEPIEVPTSCEMVFATIDTAVKTGREHDGTAVSYWARNLHYGYPLVLLDWDIISIEGSLLEAWLPTVFQNLEELARTCRARGGNIGAFIEDKVSGTILLQQARRRGWPAHEIASHLTAVGKDERAISVSGYAHRGLVKISRPAWEKVVTYHGHTRNHWTHQVFGFRVGVKHDDDELDLLDTATYGMAIALGDSKGY